MKNSIIYAAGLIGAVTARPGVNRYSFAKREVPQEQAHRNVNLIVQESLQLDNPDNIQDTVFGLLGAAAAAGGAGNIADADCLQQATADQAFTNAKAAGDVNGMTFALIYRALERNTGSVGLASVPCESIQAVNPEIAALQQHQDPASDGAAELNKQIATELAVQIASIGGDPTLANEASTFAPGEIGDPTGAGNTCDDENDDAGCINTLGLRVDDLTEDEILAAVGGDAAGAGVAAGNANNATADAGAAAAAGAGAGKKAKGAKAKGAANNAAAACSTRRARRHTRRQAADFGSCTNPSVVFGPPSDGRQEDAFEAADLTSFPHGSALNIGVISGFICSQLVNACDANDAAVALCDQADAAATGLKGQAAADAFNGVIGF
ncbi:hypothetical protein K458DRAFT_321647 [Lentithecium fluviatile CBS 122367]|uniref:Uncharacterized protein n=1 Tax=Lentithecium fluviatile CBS 122367 TaxID=1168545 RepID=A0A6G1IF70_9PLEO|nr:hypothetical protein K458DRAFT_321647 [Lentithecium fluviatile CBS 122367]